MITQNLGRVFKHVLQASICCTQQTRCTERVDWVMPHTHLHELFVDVHEQLQPTIHASRRVEVKPSPGQKGRDEGEQRRVSQSGKETQEGVVPTMTALSSPCTLWT